MRFLILALLTACSQAPEVIRPSWVDAIRKGEETLKVTHGSKIYYRRIAGSSDVTKQTACNLVIMKAEEDLRKEFPREGKISYSVEVLYYDPEYRDCAVTISIPKFKEDLPRSISSVESSKIDEASALVLNRSELASQFALTGLTRVEFEKFVNDKVTLLSGPNLCSRVFSTNDYSIHGLTYVCWKGEIITGYCTTRDRQCWTRTP